MTNATTTPNPLLPDLKRVAGRVVAKLEEGALQKKREKIREDLQDHQRRLTQLKDEKKNQQKIHAFKEEIESCISELTALKRLEDEIKDYKDAQEQERQNFIAKLSQALARSPELVKPVRKAVGRLSLWYHELRGLGGHLRALTRKTVSWRSVFVEVVARKVAADLEAEFAAGASNLEKRLLQLFPAGCPAHEAVDAYVKSLSKTPEKLAVVIEQKFQGGCTLAPWIWREMQWPLPFELVFQEERTEVERLRRAKEGSTLGASQDTPLQAAKESEYVGLALSGGGIRSATFNLGVLQGLAKLDWLCKFDYLSTVSGGGYIGSWLVTWIKRAKRGFTEVNEQLNPDWIEHSGKEPPEIEFLRSYSNYLTPQLGLLSADTWSLVAIWVRSLLLNLTILVLMTSALLLFPRLVVSISQCSHPWFFYFVPMLVLMELAILWTGTNFKLFARSQAEYPRYSEQWAIQLTIVIPTVLASWLASCWLWNEGQARSWNWWPWPLRWCVVAGSSATLLVWLVAFLLSRRSESNKPSDGEPSKRLEKLSWLSLVVSAPLVGALGGVLFFGVAKLYAYLSQNRYPGREIHFVAWGTGLVAAIFGLMVVLQIGLMGKGFPDERREWWSRVCAWVTIYTLGWMALFALALYSPLVILWSGPWLGSAATLGWLAHTIYGALGARSAKTGGSAPNNGTGILLKAAPLVFVIGLLALLSFSIYFVLPHDNPSAPQETVTVKVNLDLSQDSTGKPTTVSGSVNSAPVKGSLSYHDRAEAYWPSVTGGPRWKIVWIIIPCLGLAFVLSWRADINEFSMHLLYRNRLARCYLGASHQSEKHERNPNPFTGFDRDDDILLADFAQDAPDEEKYVGPYPVLNATLNVTHGKRLAWQERKAESFVFTPSYCGYDVKPDWQPRVKGKKKPLEDAGYRPTREYLYSEEEHCPGGPYVGTAMGISGAAFSPNMGYHSNSALAFLMTVFNLRLGWWAGNPRHQGGRWTGNPHYKLSWRRTVPPWKRRGPGLGILYLLLELFGSTDDERGYVYLSDGGHFENLGIYELVRRRCKVILACDASEDREYKFEDLGNAIRKCRDDFGVDIDIDVRGLQPGGDQKLTKYHCAVGAISYDKVCDDAKPGILIYIKASLTGDEPTDVLEYRNKHADFPHDTTADQWFSESQFESYRKLGKHVIEQCAAVDHEWRQTMTVLDLLKMDEWDARETSESLKDFLTQKLGGVY